MAIVSPMISIERTLVGWFEAQGHDVQCQGDEWTATVGDTPLPLSEIAVAIKLQLERDGQDAR